MLTQMQLLDLSQFVDKGHQLKAAYAAAEPFPHLVIDDFLPSEVLDRILEEFPNPEEIDWIPYDTTEEKTLRSKSELQIGEATRLLLYQLNSSTFLNFLEALTGMEGLLPDPHFLGSGLHQTPPGGYMKIHVDFNYHKRLPLEHRLNLLLYLNKDWREEYGGHLELWSRDMSHCVQRILPIFNRCLIFTSTETSYHGHPNLLTCPEDRNRRSLATYYYTIPPSDLGSNLHRTLWKSRPGESIRTDGTHRLIKRWTPPIFMDAWHAFKRSQGRTS
jgi:Rps23 Pro-64 3,4-dihydroxylase Tpa1-like proline 4-hydroxylase